MSHSTLHRLAATALIVGLLGGIASMATAQDSKPQTIIPDDAQELAVEGVAKILQALDLFVKSVPQYAAPEVLENGDIIIRRIHPTPETSPPKSTPPDETHT